jgi:membrane protein YqaA with SNARE-associated domain
MLRKMYDWCIEAAGKPHAGWIMGALAFAESSVLPIPPRHDDDSHAARPTGSAWRYATICTLASVAGGLVGYVIGAALYDSVGTGSFDSMATATRSTPAIFINDTVPGSS